MGAPLLLMRTCEVPSETEGPDFKFHFVSIHSNFYIAVCGIVVPILGSVVVGLPRSLRRRHEHKQRRRMRKRQQPQREAEKDRCPGAAVVRPS